ncbi:MAG: MBOAT family O-acyltransferase [Lachnospiraceae bacterium]
MGLTTLNFFLFLAVSLVVYFLLSEKYQWIWLLVVSCFFYVYCSKTLSVFITITCISTYILSLTIEKSELRYKDELKKIKAGELDLDKKAAKAQNIRRKRLCIWAGALINVGMLVVLKFWDLIFTDINTKFFGNAEGFVPLLHIGLPLGISFYTFQAVGYLVDVYRKRVAPEHNFFKAALFITFFPQIVQGPISRFEQLSVELYSGHRFLFRNLTDGFYLMLWGMFKKMVIADRAGMMVDQVFYNFQDYKGWQFWVAAIAYAFQMYGDFSGGIDIVRGAARMFGIELVDNFERPYFSKDIPEFWRRWHMTLGTWFRDYLFYPMSLSSYAQKMAKALRKKGHLHLAKMLPAHIACIVLWLANGAWHGAGTQYIVFGLYHGILTVLSEEYHTKLVELGDKLHINQKCASWRFFQIARTFFLVAIGRVIYITPNFHASLVILKSMFTAKNVGIFFNGGLYELGLSRPDFYVLLFACLILIVVEIFQERMKIREWLYEQNLYLRWGLAFGLVFTILIFGVYGHGYDAAGFIYMQY